MKDILARYGLAHRKPARTGQWVIGEAEFKAALSNLQAEQRRTVQNELSVFAYPYGVGTTQGVYQTRPYKRTIQELKLFSESALPSRAIKLIRDSICSLEYGVQPKPSVGEIEPRAQQAAIDQVREVLDSPNATDDDLPSFLGQIVEDLLVFDAGSWEYVDKPIYNPGNETLELSVVPGYTLVQNAKWGGEQDKPRWAQVTDLAKVQAVLLDRDIEYVMSRKRSWSLYGLSPLESAMEIMDAWLRLASYQREVASQAYPAFMIYLGDNATNENRTIFKQYWVNECLGRGTPGFFGNMGTQRPEVLQLKAIGDEGLYLKYQETLVRILAFCFNLKPQDFGMERDVNRSTAEVSAAASIREGARPIAQLLRSKMNQRVLPRIAELTGNKIVAQLEFWWMNLDPEDEVRRANITSKYVVTDVMTIDEARARLDLDPLEGGIGQLTWSAYKELVKLNPSAGADLEDMIPAQQNDQGAQPGAPGDGNDQADIFDDDEGDQADLAAHWLQ